VRLIERDGRRQRPAALRQVARQGAVQRPGQERQVIDRHRPVRGAGHLQRQRVEQRLRLAARLLGRQARQLVQRLLLRGGRLRPQPPRPARDDAQPEDVDHLLDHLPDRHPRHPADHAGLGTAGQRAGAAAQHRDDAVGRQRQQSASGGLLGHRGGSGRGQA
jgi:hypothetical protein